MDGGNGIPHSLPILDIKNWDRWHKQMESLFDFQDTLVVVINGVSKLAANATEVQRNLYKNSKKKDFKMSFCIQSVVYGTNFDRVAHVESAKETWGILVKYYKRGEKVKSIKLQSLLQHYKLLQMGEAEML